MSALPDSDMACHCSQGWLPVNDDYVAKQAAKRRSADGSIPAGLLDALRDSVRPCHQCQPGLYEAWRQGQLVGQGATRTGSRRRARRKRDPRDERF